MLERGASRTLFQSPDTCINNIFNAFLKGNHSPVPTLRALKGYILQDADHYKNHALLKHGIAHSS
jgi:hypothetical protein